MAVSHAGARVLLIILMGSGCSGGSGGNGPPNDAALSDASTDAPSPQDVTVSDTGFGPDVADASPTADSMPTDAHVVDADGAAGDATTEDAGPALIPLPDGTFLEVPVHGFYVELRWRTPNDPDETDEGPLAGADLDLHLAHPFANQPDLDGDGMPDPWFDSPFDCFWFNVNPNWGSFDPTVDDNPRLDRDDVDGAGPELIRLENPEAGFEYPVGVHYWDEHGYGPSFAQVRVYLRGKLIYESDEVMLAARDLWYAGTMRWGTFNFEPATAAGGGPKITADYNSALFPVP